MLPAAPGFPRPRMTFPDADAEFGCAAGVPYHMPPVRLMKAAGTAGQCR